MGKYIYGKVTPWEELHFSPRFSLKERQILYFKVVIKKRPEFNFSEVVRTVKKKFGSLLLQKSDIISFIGGE